VELEKRKIKMLNLRKYRQFLTKNERNKVYLRKNTMTGKIIADSKYKTKKLLMKNGVAVPELIKRFKKVEEIYFQAFGIRLRDEKVDPVLVQLYELKR